MNLNMLTLEVCEIAKKTGGFIRNESAKFTAEKVEAKGVHNFVTYVDKNSEKQIIKELEALIPEAGFIAEEGTTSKKGDIYNWIIDPLDGTTNFIHGLPPFAVSIALMKENEIILGVVYEVMLNECFYAWKEGGTWLNGRKIAVSEGATLNESLIATGFPYTNYQKIDPFMKSIEHFLRASHGIRRLGSAATDLAYVACGRFETFYEYGLNPWDVAAGCLLITEAGGRVSDFSGKDNYLFGGEMVAGNSLVFDEFLEIVSKYLTD